MDDSEVTIGVPSWMIRRVRTAKAAIESADAEIATANDRGERLAAEGHAEEAREELERAREMLVREVLARASRLGV
jgi:hypothetical protein